MATDPIQANIDQEFKAPGAAPIYIPDDPGGVSIEQVGEHPVVHTGDASKPGLVLDLFPTHLPMGADLAPMYEQRSEEREGAALDGEAAAIMRQAAEQHHGPTFADVAGDISKGFGIEGGRSVVTGAKTAVNETLDLADSAADAFEKHVPATLVWGSGLRGDPGFSAYFATQNDAQHDIEAAQHHPLTLMQQIGQGQMRIPVAQNEEPTTVTGNVIKNVSQFATGMLGAGKVTGGWQVATKSGAVLRALARGAIADFSVFDPHQARLSNLLRDHVPAQVKPIFDFLAADKDDPDLVGRAKSAIEGLGLGALAEGLFAGVRALRLARRAKLQAAKSAQAEGGQVPIDMPDAAAEAAGKNVQADIERLLQSGWEEMQASAAAATRPSRGVRAFMAKVLASNKTTKAAPASIAQEVTDATGQPNAFGINFNAISTAEDIHKVIADMADRFAGGVDKARRGVVGWDSTGEMADGHDWVASMGKRQVGDAANAETILAYRQVLNASATRLLQLAQAVRNDPTIATQFAFRKMLATHNAIQMEFMGARAEAGRALNAFKIPTGTPARQLRQIDLLLADTGGAGTADQLARKVLKAAQEGDVALNEMVRNGWVARTKSMARLAYTNGLLSGVGTGIVNVAGNTQAILLNLTSRALAPRMAGVFGGLSSSEVGEAGALIHGMMQATRDSLRLSPKLTAERISANGFQALREKGLWRGMAPGLDDAMPKGMSLRPEREEAGAAIGETMQNRPFSAAAWRVAEDSPLGRTLDVLQMAIESPSNANQLMDDFFKTISARGEAHAQAFRQVAREAKAGLLHSDEAVGKRLAELRDTPTDSMLEAAEREMHDLTFTRQTPGIANALTRMRQAMDDNPTPFPLGSWIMPFLRTPANLISTAMRYSPLAPLMRRFSEDIAEGGARAEITKAQMAIGTALWSYWIGETVSGNISGAGPTNRQQKEAMMRTDDQGGAAWQPYSFRVADRWFSFDRMDPLGTGMSLAADAGELLNNQDWDEASRDHFEEVQGHAIAAIGQAFFDKTSLRGAIDFTDAMSSGDADKAERWWNSRLAATVPASSALRMIRRGEDPYMREVASTWDAVRNTVPLLSEGLPVQRDLWGRARTYQTGLGTVYDAIVPVQTKAAGGSAIDLEILDNGVPVSMPQRSLTVLGENVSLKDRPDIYSEFVRLAGEPAFAKLNAVVTGQDTDSEFYLGLSDGPNGGKASYIKSVIRAYRDQARAQIMDKFAVDLENKAAETRRRREEARGGGE